MSKTVTPRPALLTLGKIRALTAQVAGKDATTVSLEGELGARAALLRNR